MSVASATGHDASRRQTPAWTRGRPGPPESTAVLLTADVVIGPAPTSPSADPRAGMRQILIDAACEEFDFARLQQLPPTLAAAKPLWPGGHRPHNARRSR